MSKYALIVGAGAGISASVARKLAARGYKTILAARNTDKLEDLANAVSGKAVRCDATDPEAVADVFRSIPSGESLDFVLYNASARQRAAFVDLDPDRVRDAIMISAYGGFLVAQEAARRMLDQGHGAIFFTGASASVKGYPQSAPFAMGKFALRGLAQSMARELQPQNIHVAHFIIDGAVRNPGRTEPADRPQSMLDPDAIAECYLNVLDQPRSVWSWEMEVRPWLEPF